MEHNLTYQWLTPIMIGMLVFLVGIIGFMIKAYLQLIADTIGKHITKVEAFMTKTTEQWASADKRLSRLEDHADLR